MGECNYYLKARFQDSGGAASALPRLAALLREGEGAYDFWQSARGGEPLVSAREFWTGFRERFPVVLAYLKDLAGTPDWNDALVGYLGCLVDPAPIRHPQGASLVQEHDLLLLQLNMVWHFSNLELLAQYCQDELGAIGVGSVSDEELDTSDDSDLEGEAPQEPGDPFDAIWV